MAVVTLGGGRQRSNDQLDYGVGCEQIIDLNAAVDKQTPLAMIYARDEDSWQVAAERIQAAITIGAQPALMNPVIYKRISE
jgi:thymidine phosphorylase